MSKQSIWRQSSILYHCWSVCPNNKGSLTGKPEELSKEVQDREVRLFKHSLNYNCTKKKLTGSRKKKILHLMPNLCIILNKAKKITILTSFMTVVTSNIYCPSFMSWKCSWIKTCLQWNSLRSWIHRGQELWSCNVYKIWWNS